MKPNGKIGVLTQDMKNQPSRNCKKCNKVFYKEVVCSRVRWENDRKFCSVSCSKQGNTYRRGKKHPNIWNKGKEGPRGAANPNWRGGRTPLAQAVRTSTKYKTWRTEIYERDNYSCVLCGVRSGNGKKVTLNADHIEAFSVIMKKHNIKSVQTALICADLWDVANGRTLCRECHIQTPNFASRAKK